MAQQPFTPTGVQAKQTELYALSNNDLLTQANLIRSDLRTWVKNNFILDQTQQAFLSSIDNRWIQETAAETGFAVENRLPVTLTTKGSGSGKLIHKGGSLGCDYSATGGFVASGSLAFTVTYS